MASRRRQREQPAWLAPLQSALVEALPRLYGATASPALAALVADLVAALEQGRLSIPLPPELAADALAATALCRDPDGPLVIEADQLSWRRWHDLRESVLSALLERVRPLDTADPTPAPLAPAGHARDNTDPIPGSSVDPTATATLDARQFQAVEAVQTHRLVLLQGGPGTGKTSTVARMLAAALERDPATRLQLAAPTGKAAARLRAATGGRHPCGTLHRLLESRGDHFARNRHHPLPLDLLVVDEVSMVDLALMAALLEALPASARLVLVGDPAQLPPIAPGAVLLDLQQPDLQACLGDAAITLTTTYRNNGAIAAVATALRVAAAPPAHGGGIAPPASGSGVAPLPLIQPLLEGLGPNDNLAWRQENGGRLPAGVLTRLRSQLGALAEKAARCRPAEPDGWQALLAERDRLLVLSPVRRGPWGVDAIHRALLGEIASGPPASWPEGLPVLCTRNLPELGLANGDVGVLVGRADSDDRQILFGEENPLWVHPAQLAGAAEPALALTVHKAQGSEAAEVIVLLGDAEPDGRLLYTALTRARDRAELITPS
jgi:exodeoxyribonuclease V alpha subunit